MPPQTTTARCRGSRLRRLLLVILLIGPGAWLVAPRLVKCWRQRGDDPAEVEHRHTGPTLEQLLPLSALVSLRVQVSDVLETRVHGRTGGISAVVLVKGEVDVSTDLAVARFEAVDDRQRTAVLSLPQPVAGQPRLDHDHTRIFALSRDGLWMLVPGDYPVKTVVNQAYDDAQRAVARAAEGEALRAKARAQAEQVLGTFFGAMHWRVEVRWGAGGP